MALRIDTVAYMDAVRDIVGAGKLARVTVTGTSMSPFLSHARDAALLEKPASPLRRGDVVLYIRLDGRYILHRIYRLNGDGTFDAVGDAQTVIERGVPERAVVARVCAVIVKGVELGPKSLRWRFFRGPWLACVPLRPLALRAYALFKRK